MSDWPSLSQPTPSRMVAHRLRRAIRSGEYEVGDRLPSHRQLAEEHGVAQNTAREALRQLAAEGLVVAQHGRGVFVTAPFAMPEGASPDYFTEPSLDPSERYALDEADSAPVYAMAGQLFLRLPNSLATADWIDAWRVTSHRFVLEWNQGPSVQSVVEGVLPRTDGETLGYANGVPGLRLKSYEENQAELTWLTISGSQALLRRLSL